MHVIRAQQVFDGDYFVGPGDVVLDGPSIVAVSSPTEYAAGVVVEDLGDVTRLPGLVDAHQHLTWDCSFDAVGWHERHDDETLLERARANARQALAAGVTTVVDLRAEKDAYLDDAAALAAGLDVVRMPIRDGQTPGADQIAAFVGIVKEAPGIVLVHCGAGVGRTGSMATAYLVATGQANGAETVVRNLSVGPPSVEQLWWMATHSSGADVPAPVVALSRVLDAPRRLLSGR